MRPRRVLPVHYDDYRVMRSSLADFLAEARRPEFPASVVACGRGERITIDAGGPVDHERIR